MKLNLFVLMIVLSFAGNAQITIDNGDFPDGGDTAMVSVSLDFGLDFTATGADYSWNYESLTMNSQRIDTFFDLSDASITYQLVFNNGWFDPDYQADYYTHLLNFAIPPTDFIGISIENPVGFTKIESDRVEIVGVGLEVAGFEVPVKNDIIDVEYELPLTYGDNWVSNSLFELDLNPAFDGILRRYQERTTQVDGWGTITTPYGTFEVVRTISFLDFTDSLRISFGGGDPTWYELPTPSQVVYTWWAKDQKIPILQVVGQDFFGSETITSVEYKDKYLGDIGISENEKEPFFLIFPNPSSNHVQILSSEPIESLTLFSLDGKALIVDGWNDTTHSFSVESLTSGVYILQIQTSEGITTKELIVK